MDHQGFLFRNHRHALRTLPLTTQQINVLNELLTHTAANSLNQIEVIRLLIDKNKPLATTLLFAKALPNQAPMRTTSK